MSYTYHVHFSQTLADGRSCDSDATLTLDQPIQYVSDLALVKTLILAERLGSEVVIKSWRILHGDQRPAAIPSHDGMNGPRVEGPAFFFDPIPADDIQPLLEARRAWWQAPAKPLPPLTVEDWARSFRKLWPAVNPRSALIRFHDEPGLARAVGMGKYGRIVCEDRVETAETALDTLRYCPRLQAQAEGMNATLLDHLGKVEAAPDLASMNELAVDMINDLANFQSAGLVPEAAAQYVQRLACVMGRKHTGLDGMTFS